MTASRQIVCPHCAGINRVPAERPAAAALCGRCRGKLFCGRPLDVDAAMFDRQVRLADMPVLVDVWAPWCAPCRVMAPAFEEAAAALEPAMRLLRLDAEAEPQTAGRLGISGIPTMILFSGGREVARVSGAMPAGRIVTWARTRLEAAA